MKILLKLVEILKKNAASLFIHEVQTKRQIFLLTVIFILLNLAGVKHVHWKSPVAIIQRRPNFDFGKLHDCSILPVRKNKIPAQISGAKIIPLAR